MKRNCNKLSAEGTSKTNKMLSKMEEIKNTQTLLLTIAQQVSSSSKGRKETPQISLDETLIQQNKHEATEQKKKTFTNGGVPLSLPAKYRCSKLKARP